MSGYLWKYYLEDDVDRFRQLLEGSGYNLRGSAQKGHHAGQTPHPGPALGSSSSLGVSPTLTPKLKRNVGSLQSSLTRADINFKDVTGQTLLHHISSSKSGNILEFAQALLAHPLLDLYIQDAENGWTALHRSFYFGNVTVARLILNRDASDLLEHRVGTAHHHSGGLVKIKDREGNGPFDLFALTIRDRTLRPSPPFNRALDFGLGDEDEYNPLDQMDNDDSERRIVVRPNTDLVGDEVFTFGSNKNITLGFGDEDDRQFPERITLRRPDHLVQRFYREHVHSRDVARITNGLPPHPVHDLSSLQPRSLNGLPTVIRATPLKIQDVRMSKLHTAVITNDPESNLFMCGHGPGGRLGTGNEVTRYQFVCVEGGAISGKKIVDIALGHNHTLAISKEGELFSWGASGYGQLGYSLPKASGKDEDPVQLLPRQIFGSLKKEVIVGIAASRIHSVVHSPTSLYTFGKNEGQLGIVDSDARSLEIQTSPRKIAASLFSSPIKSVSAIEKATICLLDNHDVWVFANYGYAKLSFPLEGFANYFLKSSFLTTKYDSTPNKICKITSGGDTICAMSTSGEIFTVNVSKRADTGLDSGTSTTNPSKIRGALSQPVRVWSAKKKHMAARDVGVDQDGSIILVTEEGSVWRRTKRAKIKDASAAGTGEYKPKDYKFSRIPGLTRVIAVRSSAHGAYAAVRKDCDVTKNQIGVDSQSLWGDLFSLVAFYDLTIYEEDSDEENPIPRFWSKISKTASLKTRVLRSKDVEAEVSGALQRSLQDNNGYDLDVTCSNSDLSLPAHRFVIAARSKVLRESFARVDRSGFCEIPDVLTLSTNGSKLTLDFQSIDFISLFNFVYYCYSDEVVDFWNLPYSRKQPNLTTRYRQVRTELMRLASRLELKQLETAARQMSDPNKTMNIDFEVAFADDRYFDDGDITIELADGEMKVHSAMVCKRCPFFKGLFQGRTGGLWLASRREDANGSSETTRIDLKHVEVATFNIVVRHIYADMGEELFNDVMSEDLNDYLALDEFIDLVMDVMSVANELMLDRLSQICQSIVGRFVNVRNICSLLNAIAPSSVTEFKDAGLEYICLNLEAVMQHRYLDELDDDLSLELDQIVHANQLASLPISRSGRAEAVLFERYPELAEKVDKSRRAMVDSIMLANKLADSDGRPTSSYRAGNRDELSSSPIQQKNRRRLTKEPKSTTEGLGQDVTLRGKASLVDLMFDMSDEEGDPKLSKAKKPTAGNGYGNVAPAFGTDSQVGSPLQTLSAEDSPTTSRHTSSINITNQASVIGTKLDSAKPWGSTPLIPQKLDMKDIMAQAQATGSQPSGLSIGLSSQQDSKDNRPSGSFHSKMSQKERKKLQQAQSFPAPNVTPQTPSKTAQTPSNKSPWQMVSAGKQREAIEQPPTESPTNKRSTSTPHLTMRQTIANPSGAAKDTPQSKSPQERSRTQSSSEVPQSTQQIVPRSVRHTPAPQLSQSETSASLFAILSQQQAEKDTIKEVVTARHDLRDIQREQEFQEWWDQESARVMLEEEERKRTEKKARGGGTRSGRGRQRGKKNVGESDQTRTDGAAVKDPAEGETTNIKTEKSQDQKGGKATDTPSKLGRGGRVRGRAGRGRGHGGGGEGNREVRQATNPQE